MALSVTAPQDIDLIGLGFLVLSDLMSRLKPTTTIQSCPVILIIIVQDNLTLAGFKDLN